MQIHDLYFEDIKDYVDTMNELICEYEEDIGKQPFTKTLLVIEALKNMLKQFESSIEEIQINKIALSDYTRYYKLKEPITITILCGNEYYNLFFDNLNIEIKGKSIDEVIDSFYNEFDLIYRRYVLCNNNELTKKGIELKNKILSYISEVINI